MEADSAQAGRRSPKRPVPNCSPTSPELGLLVALRCGVQVMPERVRRGLTNGGVFRDTPQVRIARG